LLTRFGIQLFQGHEYQDEIPSVHGYILDLESSHQLVEGVGEGSETGSGLLSVGLVVVEGPDMSKYYFPLDIEAALQVGPGFIVVSISDLKGGNDCFGWALERV
jgi:hypothetical protein